MSGIKGANRKYDWDEVKQLYLKGYSNKEISQKIGVGSASVCYIIDSFGIKKRKRNISGNKNPNWKGGVMYDRGRKLIYTPNHPNPDFLYKYCYKYRLVMEKHLGRLLDKNEVVHHINGDITDNRIKNLQVMSQGEHARLHHKKFDKLIVVCPICKNKFKQRRIKQKYCSYSCVSIYANKCKKEKNGK